MSADEDVDFDQDQDQDDTVRKGRGHDEPQDNFRYAGKSGQFEGIESGENGVQKSIEGYVVFVTGLNEETQEDDLYDTFNDYGVVTDLKFPLDRRSGYAKGYALVEYKTLAEARNAIREGDGSEFLEKNIKVDWAFKPDPENAS